MVFQVQSGIVSSDVVYKTIEVLNLSGCYAPSATRGTSTESDSYATWGSFEWSTTAVQRFVFIAQHIVMNWHGYKF